MKSTRAFHLLSASILLLSAAFAQTATLKTLNDAAPAVAAARCHYTPNEPTCLSQSESGEVDAANRTVAQFPRQMPGPPRYPRRSPAAYGRRSYASMGTPMVSGRHMLIGALVGFGLGAAVGAKGNTDPHPGVETKAICLFGGAGGLLGALMGAAIPAFPERSRRSRRPWPDDDDEQAALRDQRPGARAQREAKQAPVNGN